MTLSFVYTVAICTGLGGFTFGYDVGVISGILVVPFFKSIMGITPENHTNIEGNIASALQLGASPGILLQSFLNDWIGRKYSILISCLIFISGGILQTIAWDVWSMYAGRAVSGLGTGIMMISINMFNSEMAPKEIRGRIVGIQQFMVACGIATAYWMNYVMAKVDTTEKPGLRFRLPLALQCAPPLIVMIGLLFVPKSPRWLASKGRVDEARQSLAKIRQLDIKDPIIEKEMKEILDFSEEHDTSTWTEVLNYKNRQRLAVGAVLLAFQQFAGQNIINYFAPVIFRNIGLTGEASDLFATGMIGIVRMIMTLPALWLVDSLGRRPLLLGGTSIMALSFYYIGTYLSLTPLNQPLNGWGYIAIAGIYIFMAGYSASWGVLHYVIPAEVYPTNIRAKAETISGIIEGIFQIASIKLAPVLIDKLPGGRLFYLFAGLLTMFFTWAFICLPESKGIALENMDIVFQNWKRWQPVVIPEQKGDQVATLSNEEKQ